MGRAIWMFVSLAMMLGAGSLLTAQIRSPYGAHPHYVWAISPSFFVPHTRHDEAEVLENAIGILMGIGDFCWHEGFHFQLIRIQKAAIELDPTFGDAYENAAWLLVSYNRKDEALALLKRYLQNCPDRYEPYWELGWFYFHWQKDAEAAIPWLEKAVKFPHPPQIEHTLAHAYERAGRLKDALQVWANKLKRYPNDPVAKRHHERLRQRLEQEKAQKQL
jgi:tetratricopeptide (TPR) repeat protein